VSAAIAIVIDNEKCYIRAGKGKGND